MKKFNQRDERITGKVEGPLTEERKKQLLKEIEEADKKIRARNNK